MKKFCSLLVILAVYFLATVTPANAIYSIIIDDIAIGEDWIEYFYGDFIFIIGDGDPGSSPENPLMPIMIEEDGSFIFPLIVDDTDRTYWFDPLVATGYEYQVFGNRFASVILPDETQLYPGADNFYDLFLFNTSTNTWYDTGLDIEGGQPFSFTTLDPTGIDLFRIMGIDPRAGLDPADPTAFVTGFTFMNTGPALVTQTPLATPEPSSLILVSLGLAGLLFAKARKRP